MAERKLSDQPKNAIANLWARIDAARSQIDQIAKAYIPDFHFLDYKVSDFWDCEKSPIGWCVFKREEIRGQLVLTTCRYCGGPVERK